MALVVVPLREAVAVRLINVAAVAAVGVLAYAATFLTLAITRGERDAYISKATELVRLRRRVVAAA
jgi:hypothetical protein